MSEEFDPYRKWLGIAPHEQPPHHYRLLGIAPFEHDPDVIQNAADRQMAHVRTYQSGRFRDYSQKILNELSTANITLLDPAKKAVYDEQLHDALYAAAPPEPEPEPDFPPVAAPPPRRELAAPEQRAIPMGQAVSVASAAAPLVSVGGKSRSSASRARAHKKSSFVPIVLSLVGIGALLIGMLVFIVSQTNGPAPTNEGTPKPIAQTDKPPAPPIKKSTKNGKQSDPSEQVAIAPLPTPIHPTDMPRAEKFKLALMEARDALSKRDPAKTEEAIDRADALHAGEADAAEVKHLRTLAAYLDDFWKAVHTALTQRLQPGDVLEFRGDTVELVKREGDEFTLRYNDEDHTLKPTELRGPMAALLARKALNLREPRSLLCLAAFWTLDTQAFRRNMASERAKAYWVEAAEQGVKDAALARELGLDEAFIASIVPLSNDREPLVVKPPQPKPEDDPAPTDPPATEGTKQPVPATDELRAAKQRFQAKYGEDLARAREEPADHELFMTRLETEAPPEKDGALQYVMYQEACDAAASVLRHDVLMKLVDEMDQRWEIDALRAKQLLLLQTRPINSPATDNFADTAAALAKTAHEAGRMDVAIAAANYSLRVGDKVKGRDQKELLRRVREWEAFADAAEKAQTGAEVLAKDATDSNAHLQVGRFLCYFERNWTEGLPHLAASVLEDEKSTASEDLASPTDPLAQYNLAERWYMLAKRKSGTARLSVLDRAKYWYERALPELDEATRATTESRLREIEKDLAPLGM